MRHSRRRCQDVTDRPARSDQQLATTISTTLVALAARTLALPCGHATFAYQSQRTRQFTAIKVPDIVTSARVLPSTIVSSLPESFRTHGRDRFEWPLFNNGIATALSLDSVDRAFESSEISFSRPAELDSRHAGFLLGLGLTGHMGAMSFNQAFEYLKVKHDPTSVAVLLGLSATFKGTADPKVASLISVHLPALHPPRASLLNVSSMTQAAAIMSMGLLNLASRRQSLADLAVREMCDMFVSEIEDPLMCREAYAISAGCAYGMIMLGAGCSASTLRTLRSLILGDDNNALPGVMPRPETLTDIAVTSPAATIALMLAFLRTGRQDAADVLEIPKNSSQLDFVRPDLLTLRTLGRGLILFDDIVASKSWVEAQVPPFLTTAEPKSARSVEYDAARCHIIAGAAFAIGLKYAGTARQDAHETLLHYLDRLMRASYSKSESVLADCVVPELTAARQRPTCRPSCTRLHVAPR